MVEKFSELFVIQVIIGETELSHISSVVLEGVCESFGLLGCNTNVH